MALTRKIEVAKENISDAEHTKFVDEFGCYAYSQYVLYHTGPYMKPRQWSEHMKYALSIQPHERNDHYKALVINSQVEGSKTWNGGKDDKTKPMADTKDTNPLDVQVAGDHYKSLSIQPVEYIRQNKIGYFEGNVIKYVTRWKDKGGIKDLEKAKHYLEMLIHYELTERNPNTSNEVSQRLRYSTLETLYTCERKFQLDNLLMGSDRREESEHLSFGTAYGVGIAHYLVYQDRDEALFAAWFAYWPQIETDKKNEEIMLSAMMNAFSKCDDLLEEYEVLYYKGKPAAELTFRLDIDEDYYFTGAIDIVLKHRYTGIHYIVDVKTTGLSIEDVSPLYGNSSQTLGYSIALDAMTGEALTSYGVMYFVAQLGKTKGQSKIHVLTFEKTILDRLNWFLSLAMDCKRLKQMEEYGVYS